MTSTGVGAARSVPTVAPSLSEVVAEGRAATPRGLPPWSLYDAEGLALYEQITELDASCPTRTEKKKIEHHAEAMADTMVGAEPVTVVEPGAGPAHKTVLLLRAPSPRVVTTFVPLDMSPWALALAKSRVRRELPGVERRYE